MPNEENKEGQGQASSASEENDQEGQADKNQQDQQNIDYKAKLDEVQPLLESLKGELEQAKTRLGKSEFTHEVKDKKIKALREKLEEAGVDLSEVDKEELSESKIQEIVQGQVQKLETAFTEKLNQTVKQIGEYFLADKGKKEINKSAEGTGEILPVEEGPPPVSPKDQKLIQRYGLKWNPKTKEWEKPKK
jgi:hypothetical protein